MSLKTLNQGFFFFLILKIKMTCMRGNLWFLFKIEIPVILVSKVKINFKIKKFFFKFKKIKKTKQNKKIKKIIHMVS